MWFSTPFICSLVWFLPFSLRSCVHLLLMICPIAWIVEEHHQLIKSYGLPSQDSLCLSINFGFSLNMCGSGRELWDYKGIDQLQTASESVRWSLGLLFDDYAADFFLLCLLSSNYYKESQNHKPSKRINIGENSKLNSKSI